MTTLGPPEGKRLCHAGIFEADEAVSTAISPTTLDTTDHVQVTTQDAISTPSVERVSSQEWLEDVEVQDIGMGVKTCHSDRTLDIDAFFGKPYTTTSKDGKMRRVRDCDACHKKGHPSQIVSDSSTCRRHVAFRHAVSYYLFIIFLEVDVQDFQDAYRKWCKVNNFESMLPQDIKDRKATAALSKVNAEQTSIDGHLRPIIRYTDSLFREAAIEWLISTDQVSCLVCHRYCYSR